MSKKHSQRTRTKILAKRNTPVVEIPVRKNVGSFLAPIWKALPTHSERLRAAFDAQKYMPHFGAKQREKLTPKWKRAAQPSAQWIGET